MAKLTNVQQSKPCKQNSTAIDNDIPNQFTIMISHCCGHHWPSCGRHCQTPILSSISRYCTQYTSVQSH